MNSAHNRVDFKTSFRDFKDKRLTFSVSSRGIHPDVDIKDYLRIIYMYCDPRQIESVFGNTAYFTKLYGGRLPMHHYDLTDNHLARLTECGIHLSLTLTNHFFDESAYRESRPLLEAHHKKGNSIICTNDTLAVRLKKDFPLYELKASIIKKIDTIDKVNRMLDIYDSLTPPMDKNDDDEFLNSIQEKHRIILFGNANCAYTCPARSCYLGYSQEIFGKPVTSTCSKGRIPRLDTGHVFFNVKKLADMGFTRFKLVPLAPKGADGLCRRISWKKGYHINPIRQNKEVHFLCSYPKCGRTWLRFILAHYLNSYFNLGLTIDLHSFFSLMPTDDKETLSGFYAYRFAADRRFPLFLASHNFYNKKQFETDKNSRLVFIFRSIPDVVVSEYFHRSRFMKVLHGELKDFIRDQKGGLHMYCRYLNRWAPVLQTGQPLVLTYEMLHRAPEETMATLLSFLNIPLDSGILRRAVALSSFAAMQAMEKEIGLPDHQAAPEDNEALRMRKGTVGSSATYLDQDDYDYIHRTCESSLSDAAKMLLRQHHLWDR